MAGRGRGRGKTVSFNVEALGFGRGEALPASTVQPPPLFLPQQYAPVPLHQTEAWEYMFALKQEFTATVRKSPFYLKEAKTKKDIERYSDKYQLGQNDANDNWKPDWRRFPSELKPREKRARRAAAVKPNLAAKQVKIEEDITKTLENLEKREGEQTEAGDEEEKEEDEEDKEGEGLDEEEVFNEEDLEEETDYAMNYFDNGEGYGDDDDDADEGPVY